MFSVSVDNVWPASSAYIGKIDHKFRISVLGQDFIQVVSRPGQYLLFTFQDMSVHY